MKLIGQLSKRYQIPESLKEVLILESYAVKTRYPDDYIEITKEEYEKAVEVASDIYNWVSNIIK